MGIIFKALADDTRLRIMLLLQLMELSVGELALILDQSQPRVSRHLRILVEAGLAERHKEGSWVFLRSALTNGANRTSRAIMTDPADNADDADRSDQRSQQAQAALLLHQFLCQKELVGEPLVTQSRYDISKLAEIRGQRDERAAQYFAQHAANWDAMRSLYVPEQDIETALMALLSRQSYGKLLDIGTGTGRIIELLGDRASHNTAIDKSPEMLRFARSKLQGFPPEKLELVQGDFNKLPLAANVYNTIILHQVLHFAQNPGQVIAEAARVAAPDGQIVIIDFAPHSREELRERDAHSRLGFSDSQIGGFFERANIIMDDAVALAGGALTVKIWSGHYRPQSPDKAPGKTADTLSDNDTRPLRIVVQTPSPDARKAVA